MTKLLRSEWSFWLILTSRVGKANQYSVEQIISVGTVENFWDYFQSFPKAHELRNIPSKRISIALFRDSIKPAWEDAENANGGSYSFIVPPVVVDSVWEDLLLCAIGDTLSTHLTAESNVVNGLVVSPRMDGTYGIDLWTKDEEPTEQPSKLSEFFAALESTEGTVASVTFKAHPKT
jgi:translation initiation factor 4E